MHSRFTQTLRGRLSQTMAVLTTTLATLLPPGQAFAEGSATVSPISNTTGFTALGYLPSTGSSSSFNAPADRRIYVRINNAATERIYFGFGWTDYNATTATTDLYYRIRNAGGTVVQGPTLVPTNGNPGFIGSITAARAGANIAGTAPTGYTPLSYTPTAAGDYFFEFYRSSDAGVSEVATPAAAKALYWDFQVATTAGARANGRVRCNRWSYVACSQTSFLPDENASATPSTYIYTSDSTIMELQFTNGHRPIAFNVAATFYGVSNTSNFASDRRSVNSATSPSLLGGYPLFLNTPDATSFPPSAAPAAPSIVSSPPILGCAPPYTVRFSIPYAGDVKLLLDLNNNPGYQPGTEDRILEAFGLSAGINSINWDGNNGLGTPVTSTVQFSITISYLKGRFNLPLYDAELNTGGFNVNSIQPVATTGIPLFWDDSNLPVIGTCATTGDNQNNVLAGTTNNSLIPTAGTGAHTWSGTAGDNLQCNDFGNVRTINTWGWATTSNVTQSSLFVGCLTVQGRLFLDVDGSGTATNTNIPTAGEGGTNLGGTLFATLVDPVTGFTLSSVALAADGSYTLTSVPRNGANMTVRITSTLGAVGTTAPAAATLPNAYVATSPLAQTITTVNTNLTGINFGIEQRPVVNAGAFSAVNPGGTNLVAVPAGQFTGSDPDGTIASLRITAFPTGVTSIAVGTTRYYTGAVPGTCPAGFTCQLFPATGGVTVPANTAGNPTTTIAVDPLPNSGTVVIPYVYIDNANRESFAPANVTGTISGYSISGGIFNDVNGLNGTPANTVDASGSTQFAAGAVNAVLVDVADVVIASTPVAAGGGYSFTGIEVGSYRVRVSATAQTPGATFAAATFPTNYVPTGEFVGAGAGNDGTADGTLAVSLSTANVTNVNLGLERPPTAAAVTQAAQPNPGGTLSAVIPAAAFSGTEYDGGLIQSMTITQFPTGATSFTIGGITYYPTGATLPTTCPTASCVNFPATGGITGIVVNPASGQPTNVISVDPAVSGATTVVFGFNYVDNAGKVSNTATLTTSFAGLAISGSIFNDVNGLNGTPANTVDASGTAQLVVNGAYAVLVNSANVVVASAGVAAGGGYSFTNLDAGAYRVLVSSGLQSPGATFAAATFPAGFSPVGENIGTAAGSDGTADGSLSVSLTTVAVTNANLGIERSPTAAATNPASQVNPGGTASATVPASAFAGTEYDGGSIASMTITQFPTGATSFAIGGITYYPTGATLPTTCPTASCVNFPATGGLTGIVVNPGSGQPTNVITVDPAAAGVTSVAIPFAYVDNAGITGNIATVTVPFNTVSISGTVFNDANGITDNALSGTQPNLSNTLYANLVQAGSVIATVAVAPNGAYSFPAVDGGAYSVVLREGAAPGTTPSLPAAYANTSEALAPAFSDGTVDGILALTVGNANVTGANFGIELRPTVTSGAVAAQVNPGGTSNASVAPTAFGGSDVDGTVTAIRITAFPTNATSITAGLTTYYPTGVTPPAGCASCQNFPPSGINVPANALGQPTSAIAVDPVSGPVTVVIPFVTVDNAGKESAASGTASVPFTGLSLSGTVFNDANGLLGTPANTVDGTGMPAGSVFAVLVNSSNVVVASQAVATNGAFTFTDADAGVYRVLVSASAQTPGAVFAAATYPAGGYVSTGEFLGAGPGNDGAADGSLSVTLSTTSVSGANLGLDRRPVTDAKSYSASSPNFNSVNAPPAGFPVVTGYKSIAMNSPVLGGTAVSGSLSATDAEDCAAASSCNTGSSRTFRIATVNPNTLLYYNFGTTAAPNIQPVAANTNIPNYDISKMVIYGQVGSGSAATAPLGFTYSLVDAAGVVSLTSASYVITTATPLPVVLRDFTAQRNASCESQLRWSTAAEEGVRGFTVERSADGRSWTDLVEVATKGPDSHYEILDRTVATAPVYYRLRVDELSGSATYSAIAAITGACGRSSIMVAPNPATDKVLVSGLEPGANLKLLSAQGQVLLEMKAASDAAVVPLMEMPAGVYLLQVSRADGSPVTSVRILKR